MTQMGPPDNSLFLDRRATLTVPGMHAIFIGVSEYPHLSAADEPPGEGLRALRPITRSALTALRIMEKFQSLDREARLIRPLKTVRLLLSPSREELAREPALQALGARDASAEAIRQALRGWRADLAESPDAQALFFFSGHTLRQNLSETLLCANDMLLPDAPLLEPAVSFMNVFNGMAPSLKNEAIGRSQFYFLDSASGPSSAFDTGDDAKPPRTFDAVLAMLDDRSAPVFAGENADALNVSAASGLTCFGDALLWGLEHGTKEAAFNDSKLTPEMRKSLREAGEEIAGIDGKAWPVTTETLIAALRTRSGSSQFGLTVTGLTSNATLCFRRTPPIDPEDAAAETKAATLREAIRTQRDSPAQRDLLGRESFARVIARKITDARATRDDDPDDRAFMVHLHGPWGSGKSSVLNFVKIELTERQPPGKEWLVVWFNAWKHQRLRPPWWNLITSIYHAALADKQVKENGKLRQTWWKWRLRADWLPIILVALLLGIVGFGLAKGFTQGESLLKFVAALAAAAAGVYGYVRLLLLGSSKAAQAYSDSRTDPFGPIIALLSDLVTATGRDVIVFIDDLDRCDSDYVVELLEGIQTLQRSAAITWLVAADRKWIRSSFERKYADFSGVIGDSGRPLGYLFLDKIFQLSVGIPKLTGPRRAEYWKHLLEPDDGSLHNPSEVKAAEVQAKAQVEGLTSHEDLQQVVDASANESAAVRKAVREQAALQITSAAAVDETEHRLMKFSGIVEANPRAMKRLANAVNTAQACSLIDGRTIDPDLVARWTMIELRWPILAERIAENPALITEICAAKQLTPALRKEKDFDAIALLHCDEAELLAILREGDGFDALSVDSLRTLLH